MEKRTELGMNRTGAQASPIDVGKLAKFAQDQPATQSDETIADLRAMALAAGWLSLRGVLRTPPLVKLRNA